jgi:hypothetical protein
VIPTNKQEVLDRQIREELGTLRDGELRFVGLSQRVQCVSKNPDDIWLMIRDSLGKANIMQS